MSLELWEGGSVHYNNFIVHIEKQIVMKSHEFLKFCS